ncbi:MAG TPA: S41 family peptidase [Planctomycetota bacterium]|jgi:carboxyl-terminal processing protease|nr:S41 family peptidase [Planctomycetota bacterium]
MAFRSPLAVFATSMALAAGTAFVVARATAPAVDEELQREAAVYARIRNLIREEYVDEVEPRTVLYNALHGMVEGLDPYSRFYEPEETRSLEEETSGRFAGIGIVIEPGSLPITIAFPQPESPAERSGLRVGDRIVEVDGLAVDEADPEEARDRIRGREGTEVRLAVLPADGGPRREILVRREGMRDTSVSLARILDPERRIGYLWISSFSEETVGEFDEAMEGLNRQGMKGLVLDLRFNPGGVLDAAVTLANRFVREGLIVYTRGRTDESWDRKLADAEQVRYEGVPVVLLQNGSSASAAEVLAGALQDHRVAVLLGEPSFGKGLVQSIRKLEDEHGAVKLTTARYYTPLGRTFERDERRRTGGIEPDVLVEVSERAERLLRAHLERYEVPERYRAEVEARRRKQGVQEKPPPDPQLDAALALLRGEPPRPRRIR